MPFGFNFGKKKSKSERDSTITTDEVFDENTFESGRETSNSLQSVNGTSTTNSIGRVDTSQITDAATNRDGTQSSDQLTRSLPQGVFDELASGVQNSLGGFLNGGGAAGARIASAADTLGDFDSSNFIAGATNAAKSQLDIGLRAGIGATAANTGGSVNENSATALLANRLANENAATLGGVQSQAAAQAAQIAQGNLAALASSQQVDASNVLSAADILKGALVSQSGNVRTSEAERQLAQVLGQTGTTESSNTQTAETTSVLSELERILESFRTGNSSSVQQENTKTKGSELDGGITGSIK